MKRSEKQIHGSIMIVAWILLSTSGIFTGRFMRHVLGEKGFWFKIHMYSQLGAVLLTTVGYIYITMKVQDSNNGDSKIWSDHKKNDNDHRQIGFTVWILSLIQVTLGYTRNIISGEPENKDDPHDHGPRRWIFQLLHMSIGYVSWLLAVISIWYGIRLLGGEENSNSGDEAVDASWKTVWALYVGFTIVVFLVLELMKFLNGKRDKLAAPPSEEIWSHAFAVVVACAISASISLLVAVNDKSDKLED